MLQWISRYICVAPITGISCWLFFQKWGMESKHNCIYIFKRCWSIVLVLFNTMFQSNSLRLFTTFSATYTVVYLRFYWGLPCSCSLLYAQHLAHAWSNRNQVLGGVWLIGIMQPFPNGTCSYGASVSAFLAFWRDSSLLTPSFSLG